MLGGRTFTAKNIYLLMHYIGRVFTITTFPGDHLSCAGYMYVAFISYFGFQSVWDLKLRN
jgi:hypothetical protein